MTSVVRTAVVTGGSRGIGFKIAEYLAENGWALTLVSRRSDQLAEAREKLRPTGAAVNPLAVDLSAEDAASQVIESHRAAYGTMNALIMAAGVGTAARIDGFSMRRVDKQFAVNFRSPYELVGRALPLLRETAQADPSGGARVIALSSLEGVHPEKGLSAYAASKAALLSLVRSINCEEGENGVSATAISPAYVDTDMAAWTAETISPASMLTVSDIVRVVDLALNLSPNAVLPHVLLNRRGGGAYRA